MNKDEIETKVGEWVNLRGNGSVKMVEVEVEVLKCFVALGTRKLRRESKEISPDLLVQAIKELEPHLLELVPKSESDLWLWVGVLGKKLVKLV